MNGRVVQKTDRGVSYLDLHQPRTMIRWSEMAAVQLCFPNFSRNGVSKSDPAFNNIMILEAVQSVLKIAEMLLKDGFSVFPECKACRGHKFVAKSKLRPPVEHEECTLCPECSGLGFDIRGD